MRLWCGFLWAWWAFRQYRAGVALSIAEQRQEALERAVPALPEGHNKLNYAERLAAERKHNAAADLVDAAEKQCFALMDRKDRCDARGTKARIAFLGMNATYFRGMIDASIVAAGVLVWAGLDAESAKALIDRAGSLVGTVGAAVGVVRTMAGI